MSLNKWALVFGILHMAACKRSLCSWDIRQIRAPHAALMPSRALNEVIE
jgi:hypothetical protein